MRQSHVFLLLQLSGYKDKINCKKSYNVSLLQLAHITDPGGGGEYWYGAGGWSKKLKHWLKLLAISTYKIDFAFDGSHIQTRGEVG